MMARIFCACLVCLALAIRAECQTSSLQPGVSIERHIGSGDTQAYTFDAPAKQIVRFFIAQTLPFPVAVKLIGPTGRALAERTSRQNILFSAVTEDEGRYALEVVASKTPATTAGDYRIGTIEFRSMEPDGEALLKADADYTEYRRAAPQSSEKPAADLDAAAALYEQLGQHDFEGWALLLAGQYRVRLSDYPQAQARYARSAEAFQKANHRSGRAEALDFLADISEVLREHPKAIEAATEVLALAREEHLPALEAAALNNLGRANAATGEKQRALDYFAQAVAAARAIRDRAREAAVLRSSAALHNQLGDHEQALAQYKEVLAIERERGQKLNEAAALSNIGASYASLKQIATAIEYFEQAIALFRATGGGRPALATTLSDSGQAYLDARQPAKAEPLLQEALAIARETKNRWSESYTLINMARARDALKDPEKAAGLLAEALPIAVETRDPQLQALVRFQAARVARNRAQFEFAREHADEAIRLMESIRDQVSVPDLRSSLVAEASEFYQLEVDVLMQLHRAEAARVVAERGRARNLLDVLAAAGVPRGSDEGARGQDLRRKLNQLSSKRTSLQRAKASSKTLATVDREIDETWTELQSLRSTPVADTEPMTLDTFRTEALDANTILLEYSLGEPRSYLWAISRDKAASFELAARGAIEEAARVFWESVKGARDAGEVERAAAHLSKLVLAPARGLLESKRLLIAADGALQYVPFAAVADPARTAYRPLIEAHEVIEEPSASALVLLHRAGRKPAAGALALFADPVFESDDPRLRGTSVSTDAQPAFLKRAADLRLARLPATRREAQAVASLVPESQRWLALDFDATREAATSARISGYRILHFATHGIVDTARPELSALAFSFYDAQARPRDGFLRLYEIFNLNLQADLVVLSACDTALGREVRGEGLIGLARGFMHAGAPRVAASLWKVDDQATSELMRLFYAAMLGPGHKSAAAALREAQLTLAHQERWRAPYYWASFILQGEWR